MFIPRLDILPEAQRKIWPRLAVIPGDFTLYGGTAIALRLGHRPSVDFDFFSDVELDETRKATLLKLVEAGGDQSVLQNEKNTLSFTVEHSDAPVKLSFCGGPWFRSRGSARAHG
jgi:hypothetical protein